MVETCIIMPSPAKNKSQWAIKNELLRANRIKATVEIEIPRITSMLLFFFLAWAEVMTAPIKLPAPAAERRLPNPWAPDEKTRSAMTGIKVWNGQTNRAVRDAVIIKYNIFG